MARVLLVALLAVGCDRGNQPRLLLTVLTPDTDPFESAAGARVRYESETPFEIGPVPVSDGHFEISIDLPADASHGRFVVEAVDSADAVLGHGATPSLQPLLVAGIEARVLVSVPLLPEGGPAPPPEPLGAPAAAPLGEHWIGTTTEGGALVVYDLLTHEWVLGVVEPAEPVEEATAVTLPDRRLAFAGGTQGGIRIYEGLRNAWRDVELPEAARGPWIRPAPIECPDGSWLLVGGGDGSGAGRDLVVRVTVDGTATEETPLETPRAGHTATGDGAGRALVVGGAPGDSTVEVVGCDGTRDAVSDVADADRTGHGAVRLADGSVLVAGGIVGGAETANGLWLPRDCSPSACEPLALGPLLPMPRADLVLAALPEGGAVALGSGRAAHLDPDSWEATELGGVSFDASPVAFPTGTGHLVALDGDRMVFLAPRTLFPP